MDYIKHIANIISDDIHYNNGNLLCDDFGKEMKFIDKLNLESLNSLKHELLMLKSQMAQAAQNIYDEWEGTDEGGICDRIADSIAGIISSNIEDVEIDEYGHDGDDHASLLVSKNGETYVVDIPHYVYEIGGGYSWRKIAGVKFDPSHVQIFTL